MNGLQITKGSSAPSPRMLVYGVPGVGKSTLAASMPKPLFLDFDRGIEQIGPDRIEPPRDWPGILGLLDQVVDRADYKTIVIDTIDPMEESATRHVCERGKKQTLAEFDWGGGYEALAAEWRVALSTLERARSRGVAVCMLAHSIVRTAQDPTLGAYDAHTPQLQKKTWAATHRWCDVVGFATFDAAKVGDERRAIVTGDRVLLTTRGTGYEAKNRYGLPTRLPLSWTALAAALATTAETPEAVRARIVAFAAGTEHAAKAAAFIADAREDVRQLLTIEDALKERLGSR